MCLPCACANNTVSVPTTQTKIPVLTAENQYDYLSKSAWHICGQNLYDVRERLNSVGVHLKVVGSLQRGMFVFDCLYDPRRGDGHPRQVHVIIDESTDTISKVIEGAQHLEGLATATLL